MPTAATRLSRRAWPLVVCAIVALLWPLSFVFALRADLTVAGRHLKVDDAPGWFGFTVGPASPTEANRAHLGGRWWPRRDDNPRVFSGPGDYRFYSPLWMVTLAAAVVAGGILISRHRGRPRPGQCRGCGYDLRASPGRCPECGATP